MVMPRSFSMSMLSRTWAVISRAVRAAGLLDETVGEGALAVVNVGHD
jgi:hypothetical protein